MASPILVQTHPTRNGTTVRTRRPLRTTGTGIVLPVGSLGRVLGYNPKTNQLVIDFGVGWHVQAIPLGSHTIEAGAVR